MAVYRAEVVGSLLRPQGLMAARARWDSQGASNWDRTTLGTMPMFAHGDQRPVGTAELKRLEDAAVDQAIALQEAAGVDIITDGEQRRVSYFDPLFDAVEGLAPIPSPPLKWEGEDGAADLETRLPFCITGRLRQRRSLALEEFAYARGKAQRPLKVTLPSPVTSLIIYSPEHSRDAYPDPFDLLADAVAVLRQEVRQLVAAGCGYIQFDAAELCALCTESSRRSFLEPRGVSPERLLHEVFEYINAAADCPGVTFAMHLCRGSLPHHHAASGGYDAISRDVLARATNIDVFLLEYHHWRTGSFAPLADLPRDKQVVLGLVSAKSPELESIEALVAKVEEASRYFPRENLAISTQCGFGSGLGFDTDPAIQGRKLHLVAEAARRIWK
jgi:5-methyltetrahydropteroyltriglutamate--homocysteine methyltransferase